MNRSKTIAELRQEFHTTRKLLIALGDEVRQNLFLLMLAGNQAGVRVVDLAEKTNLTRPAVSHHMQILKDSGMIKCRKEGKFTYYYFDRDCDDLDMLIRLLERTRCIIQSGETAQNQQTSF